MSSRRHSRRQLVGGALLVVAGAALFTFVVRPMLGPPEREWQAQIAMDSVPLTQILRFDLRVPDTTEVEAAWAKRRVFYDAERLAELRDRLTAFVEFQVAEYADAKDIYDSARDPERTSAAALAAHDRLRGAFGSMADEMIRQYADRVREPAYKASPRSAGFDPDLPDFADVYRDVVGRWLPEAKATIERLTTPAR